MSWSTVFYIALGWLVAAFIGGPIFCWLIHRGIIGFAPIEDRNEFSRNWEGRP